MQTEPNAKQQIVEKIKNSTNILVTVGRNPSVDALSAALSLTLMLNRLDKHATAVFSGEIPPAIGFLNPDKTFENTVDSLRDFIIALDKEKADRLRYKVEDDVVRIFITPYKTVISEADLKFSQGDFNVELIVALGVEKREDLDEAITAHGRILHDASVVTINADGGVSNLGSTDWSDANASSLCEMLMSLSEALQSGLLDQQIATAVLTGIVAATDRFRNEHTSPRVMTMAAQLMAAGANQQLIAAKLEEGHALPDAGQSADATDGSTNLAEGKSQKITDSKDGKKKKNDGSLTISHEPEADASPLPDPAADALKEAETELAESLEQAAPAAPTVSVDELKKDLEAAAAEVDEAAEQPAVAPAPEGPQIKKEHRDWRASPAAEPTFGGTLNATAGDEEEAKRKEYEEGSRQILSHSNDEPPAAPGSQSVNMEDTPPVIEPIPAPVSEPAPAPVPAPPALPELPGLPEIPSFEEPQTEVKPLESTSDEALSFEPAPVPDLEAPAIETTPALSPTLADIDSQNRGKEADADAEAARAAVDAALSSMPFDPSGQPSDSLGAAPGLEVVHDTPAMDLPVPPQPITPTDFDTTSGATAAPGAFPAPPAGGELPPLPDFSTLPPLPGEDAPVVPEQPSSTTPPAPAPIQPTAPTPAPTDPGQFKIPGQS